MRRNTVERGCCTARDGWRPLPRRGTGGRSRKEGGRGNGGGEAGGEFSGHQCKDPGGNGSGVCPSAGVGGRSTTQGAAGREGGGRRRGRNRPWKPGGRQMAFGTRTARWTASRSCRVHDDRAHCLSGVHAVVDRTCS